MPDDYIPSNDAELIEFARNFQAKTADSPTDFNLTAVENSELNTLIQTFKTDYTENNLQQTAARASRQKKDDSKKLLVPALRKQSQTAQTSNITDEQRTELGLTVRDKTKTSVGAPETFPVARIDTKQQLRHIIKFYDSESESKGKPAGVRGAQIWIKIGGEPTINEDDYRYLATDTESPYMAAHKAEDVGKQAHYILRWENSKGETGAWSSAVSATITG